MYKVIGIRFDDSELDLFTWIGSVEAGIARAKKDAESSSMVFKSYRCEEIE